MDKKAEKALWAVRSLEDDAERAYDNDPASSYRLSAKAATARRAWVDAYPVAATEVAEQQRAERAEQERAERRKINLTSYVARGMD